MATRFVQPGRLPWQAIDDQHSIDSLARRLQELNYRAAIVGPHGSGKSTLLEHLSKQVGEVVFRAAAYEPVVTVDAGNLAASSLRETASRRIIWLTMRGRTPSAQLLLRTRPLWQQAGSLLVIDGYEQLSLSMRWGAIRHSASCGAGLLVTSHRRTWLPTLVTTSMDVHLAQSLLDQLLPKDLAEREKLMSSNRLQSLLDKHRGNLREVFMELYDHLES